VMKCHAPEYRMDFELACLLCDGQEERFGSGSARCAIEVLQEAVEALGQLTIEHQAPH
jgi:hypothetical protein